VSSAIQMRRMMIVEIAGVIIIAQAWTVESNVRLRDAPLLRD